MESLNSGKSAPRPVKPPPRKPVKPPAGETLRVGIGIKPDTLEPSQVTNSAVANLLENVVETLVTVGANGKIVPNLAKSWKVSADGRQFTFTLPKQATFQDGAPLDAKAVAWNADRLVQINAVAACPVAAAELSALKSVEAVDATTVRYNLSRPLPNFLASLSWIAWGILSPRSAGLAGNQLLNIQRPVGTGPFRFDALSADGLQLARFDGFRGERPFFDKLAFQFISSPQGREAGLRSNQLDVVLLPSVQQLPAFSKSPQFAVVAKPGTRSIFVNLHNQRPPFNDARVRRAVNLAVDKQAIIKQVLQGAAAVSDSPVAPSVFGYCRAGSYDYDPKAAKALLAEAKVRPGTPLTLLTPRGRYLEDEAVAQRIAGYLGDVGFKVTVQALEWPALMGAISRPPDQVKADMYIFGWAPTFADAGWQLPQLYDSRKWPPFGPAGSFYKNPEVEKLLDATYQTQDPRRRADLFCQAGRKIWADAPVIFLWVQSFPVTHKQGLTNIVLLPNEKVSLAFARRVTVTPPKPAPAKSAKKSAPAKSAKSAKKPAPAKSAKKPAPAKSAKKPASRTKKSSR